MLPVYTKSVVSPIQALQDELKPSIQSWLQDPLRKRGCIALATGMGKTRLALDSLLELGYHKMKNTLWITHRDNLIEQVQEVYSARTEGERPGLIKAGVCDVKRFTALSLMSYHDELPVEPDLVIIDEAHHMESSTYQDILLKYKDAKVLTLTATPYVGRVDNPVAVGEILAYMSTRDGIERKILCPYNETKISLNPSTQAVEQTIKSDVEINKVVNATIELAKKGHCICFGVDVEHCTKLANAYNELGVIACVIDSQTPVVERRAVMAAFKANDGSLDVIINHDIYSEGSDIPQLKSAILARPTDGTHKYIQMLGRVLRTHPDKSSADVVSVVPHEIRDIRYGIPVNQRDWDRFKGVNGIPMEPNKYIAALNVIDGSGLPVNYALLKDKLGNIDACVFAEDVALKVLELGYTYANVDAKLLDVSLLEFKKVRETLGNIGKYLTIEGVTVQGLQGVRIKDKDLFICSGSVPNLFMHTNGIWKRIEEKRGCVTTKPAIESEFRAEFEITQASKRQNITPSTRLLNQLGIEHPIARNPSWQKLVTDARCKHVLESFLNVSYSR